MTPTLLLVGSGVANLCVLEAAARGKLAGTRTVLVAPRPVKAWTRMFAGLVEGRYQPNQLTLDLARLAKAAGADFVGGRAVRIDAQTRHLELEDGASLRYDVASLAIGAAPAGTDLPGINEHAFCLRPAERAAEIPEALRSAITKAPAEGVRIVVVGAGVDGFEIALALRRRLDRLAEGKCEVTLVDAAPTVLPGRGTPTMRAAMDALYRNDVSVILGGRVTEASPDRVTLANGARVRFDLLIWAAGDGAPTLFDSSGLVTDRRGFLQVDDRLRAIGHSNLFGAGAAVAVEQADGAPGARTAVRQGEVLSSNIAAVLAGRVPARRYRPGRRYLSTLSTGDGRAILSYGTITASGPWVMRLKDGMDRRLVRRFSPT